MDEIGSFLGGLLKNFPIAGILIIVGVIYTLWYATGGVERGEERRAQGEKGLFIEVNGVPDEYEENELFGSFPIPTGN